MQQRSGPSPTARTLLALVGLLVTAFLARSGGAGHRASHDGAAAGRFDYYVLTLSWSPAYCLESPTSTQCTGTRAYGFVVHGLWPQNEHGWPERCDTTRVPEELATQMLDLMPARGLIYHEWSTHGTCSGLDPSDYFRLVRRARATVSVPPGFGTSTSAVEQPPSALKQSFLRANPGVPEDALVVSCSGGQVPRLRELRVCLTRELAPRTCSADVLRVACRAPTLLVPPLR